MARLLVLLAVASLAAAQVPIVGDINFYGLRKVTPERILEAVKLSPGDRMPASKGDLEERIANVSGIVLARVEAVCCEGRSAVLFIGVEERGAPHATLRSEPAGSATLPGNVVESYAKFLSAVRNAASRGNSAEDLTAGHSLMADPAARALQLELAAFTAENLPLVRDVVRNGSLPGQRAIAAAIIGYAPRKREAADDLQYALSDPDESVRANAMRSLNAIAVFASRQPDSGIRITATWFTELLNSVVLSDRVESVKVLLTLTDKDGPAALDLVRERALPAVLEMARWKTASYAAPPFLLAGRLAGMKDEEIEKAWERGEREPVLEKAQRSPATVRER